MKIENLPDAGAYITVHLRGGLKFTGYVDGGHTWASGGDSPLFCLLGGRGQSAPDDVSGELLYQYVDPAEIIAFTWDCRP